MIDNYKYICFTYENPEKQSIDRAFLLFPAIFLHVLVQKSLDVSCVSAGFVCASMDGDITAIGKSEGLGMTHDLQDTDWMKKTRFSVLTLSLNLLNLPIMYSNWLPMELIQRFPRQHYSLSEYVTDTLNFKYESYDLEALYKRQKLGNN